MAKFNGDLFLVQSGDGGGPEVFVTIACMRSTSFSLNNEQIDTTSKCDTPWRTLLEGGVRSMSLSLAGVMNDAVVIQTMIIAMLAGSISNYKIISEYGDEFLGAFQAASFERSGEYNDAEQYTMTLESSGAVAYTPPP